VIDRWMHRVRCLELKRPGGWPGLRGWGGWCKRESTIPASAEVPTGKVF
jgi:hypothetical protein